MYLLKNQGSVVAESAQPIEYVEKQKAWLVMDGDQVIWYVDTDNAYTVEQAPDLVTDGGPSVTG